jgi:WD40 repeat protein
MFDVISPRQDGSPLQLAAFSPDRRHFATSASFSILYLWDFASEREIARSFSQSEGPAIQIAVYAPDGKFIATGGNRGEVTLWDPQSAQLVHDLRGQPPSRILALAFSPDSNRLVSSALGKPPIMWDMKTGNKLSELPSTTDSIFALAFSRDGKRLALGGGQLRILDATSFKELFQGPGTLGFWEEGLTFSPDGRTLAAVGANGVALWRGGTNGWQHLAGTVGGTPPQPVQIAFTRDGKRLVTPGVEHTIKIWDTTSATELTTMYYQGQTFDKRDIKMNAVVFSPDERQVYAIGDDWSTFRFPIALDDLIAEARHRLQKSQ